MYQTNAGIKPAFIICV